MIKKIIAFFLLNICFASIAYSQEYKGEIDSAKLPEESPSHYISEYTLDAPVNPGAWKKEKQGMHVAFGSENELYFRTEVPPVKDESVLWTDTGWKGERLNAQMVVWSPDTLQQVRFKISDLRNEKGDLLSKKCIELYKVCYVVANFPYGSNEPYCGPSSYKNGFLMPDRFETFDRFDVPGRTVRPVWLSLNIPADAIPGIYTGTIEVNDKSEHSVLRIKIKVQDQLLPPPHEWHYRLDLWQNPWIIADYYHIKPWGEIFKKLLKKHLKLYADAGGTYITTYCVNSPWGDNEYGIEKNMIKWIKQKDGSWRFDYHIFDEYVELAMSVGIDKAITIYTPLPYNNRFRYMDEASGNYVIASWPPDSKEFKTVWNIFLNNLKLHLQKKGWLNKTYIGMNESQLSQTLAAIKVIKDNSKEWKFTYAGNWHKELDTLLNDYCFLYGNEATVNEVKVRKARGQTTTYYVCCQPAKPNTFLFSPPVEARWISWYAAAHGYNGFLRWAYDAWPEDPRRDGRYGSWASGDCYLVYPGGNSCIRFEKLREGIVDYEKIGIIRSLAAKSSDRKVKNLMKEFNAHLQTLNNETPLKDERLKDDISEGRVMINELSEMLSKTK